MKAYTFVSFLIYSLANNKYNNENLKTEWDYDEFENILNTTKAKLKEAEARVRITRSYFYLTLGLSALIIILLLALLFHSH